MRSKVERRMARETGRTQRELRRAVKLRKKLMTEDEKLIYNLRRVSRLQTCPHFPFPPEKSALTYFFDVGIVLWFFY
jgi:hypothetical protein